jgi:epoxyqueuosine reductase
MNVARAMGNSRDEEYIPDLLTAFNSNDDERVLGIISWALGRIGSPKAKKVLDVTLLQSNGIVRKEILYALNMS